MFHGTYQQIFISFPFIYTSIGPQDNDTTLDRDIRRTNPTIDYLFQAMHFESKFHTRRETDPTCLTPAARYTEGIIGPKILSRQSDSAFTIEYRSCGIDPFRRLRLMDIYPDFFEENIDGLRRYVTL